MPRVRKTEFSDPNPIGRDDVVVVKLDREPYNGDTYLEQALEALRDSSSADVLYRDLDPFHDGQTILGPAQQTLDASNRRLRYLRSAVLFAALAIEAYANEFLAATLATTDVESLDRLQTVEKPLIGPKVAGLATPFDRGAEPIQSLVDLFKARNRLVHPRPGEVGAYAHATKEGRPRATRLTRARSRRRWRGSRTVSRSTVSCSSGTAG